MYILLDRVCNIKGLDFLEVLMFSLWTSHLFRNNVCEYLDFPFNGIERVNCSFGWNLKPQIIILEEPINDF